MNVNGQLSVRYISLPPGAGKTEAAVEYMKQHVQRNLSEASFNAGLRLSKFILYVAPTKKLLLQTFNRLQSVLEITDHDRLRFVASDDSMSKDDSVAAQLSNCMHGLSNEGDRPHFWGYGSVLFLTHNTFLKELKKYPRMCERATVLFDESRKWATQESKVIPADDKVQSYLSELFDLVPVADGSKFFRMDARDIPESKKAVLLKYKAQAQEFPLINDIHERLTPSSHGIIREQAYTYSKYGAHNLVTVVLPSHPFRGFKAVYILSADFKTSQMYWFLKSEGVKTVSFAPRFMDALHPLGHDLAIERATQRFQYLRIIPLLRSSRFPSLNKYRKNHPILPVSEIVSFGDALAERSFSTGSVLDAIKADRAAHKASGLGLAPHQSTVLELLTKHKANFDSIEWLIDQAFQVFHQLERGKKPLIFVNKDFHEKLRGDKRFIWMEHALAEGDNSRRKHNKVAFLAATNPGPDISSLLRLLLGSKYDPDEDHILDKAVQSIGRCNIREHSIKTPAYAIVPTLGMAQRLARRYGNQCTVDESHVGESGYDYWDLNTYIKMKNALEGNSPPARFKPSEEQKRDLKVLRKRRDRAKKSGKLDVVAEIEKQIEAVKNQSMRLDNIS